MPDGSVEAADANVDPDFVDVPVLVDEPAEVFADPVPGPLADEPDDFEDVPVLVDEPAEVFADPVPGPLADEPDDFEDVPVLVDEPAEVFADPVPGPLADEPDEFDDDPPGAGAAQAIPPPVKTAAPTPNATARPPIRPIYLEALSLEIAMEWPIGPQPFARIYG
jgi:hypothetical protein